MLAVEIAPDPSGGFERKDGTELGVDSVPPGCGSIANIRESWLFQYFVQFSSLQSQDMSKLTAF